MTRSSARRRSSSSRAIVVRPTIMRAPSRSAPARITVRVPSPSHRFGKTRHHLRRAGRRLGGMAYEERHRIGAILGGFALGLIDKSGVDLPRLPMLGKAGTLGVAAWALGKWGKSAWASHAATGLLSIAAYELAKEGSISGYGDGTYDGGYMYDPNVNGYVAGW